MADFVLRIGRLRRINRRENVERRILDRTNPLEVLTEEEVRDRYRFYPSTVLYIVGLVEEVLTTPTFRASPLPPLLCVMTTLYFFATGTHHIAVADVHGVSRSSVGRAVDRVVDALLRLMDNFIKMPDRANETMKEFYNIASKY